MTIIPKLLGFGLAVLSIQPVLAQSVIQRDGYVRRDGVYVPPSYQTAPNHTRHDNWSTRGNVNPYTGRPGYVDPYRPPNTNFGSPPSRRGW